MERTEQITVQPSPGPVVTLDHWGTTWGTTTVQQAEAEADIKTARTQGATIDEWETTDRDDLPLRVVRVTHPRFGTDICVFTSETHPVVAA
ncbi:hypothetical protein [Streptomyces huasconensis]|uniref:hypothetical protein n=1 Tax=Streptomyces huasconensis TaxID=1854574 RepID=UPI0036FCFA60